MSITVKLVNGSQKSVDVADFQITVFELKKLMEPVLDIPANEQRIVLRGKVLKDDQVLSAVGMEAGNAIHVVRAKKPMNATSASSTNLSGTVSSEQGNVNNLTVNSSNTANPVENTSATSPNNTPSVSQQNPASAPVNPYAALMSGFTNNTFGGQSTNNAPSPPNTMNPFAANNANIGSFMPPYVSREEMSEVSRNPMMQQMMAQMMQNPQLMQQVMESSPYLQNMPAESRQAMLQLMSNPQFLEAAMNNLDGVNNFGNLAGGSTNPTASSSSSSIGSGAGSGSAMPNNFNFNPNMMNMPFPQLAPQPQGDPHVIYRDQLNQLREMGFPNEEANIAALQQANGNIHFAIERLFNPE